MKITLVIARYSISGVPLAQLRLAESLTHRGHEVTVIFGYADKKIIIPKIGPAKIKIWNARKVRSMFLPLIFHFITKKPDIVFTSEDHLNVIVLAAAIISRTKAKITASSRVTPLDTYSNDWFSKRGLLKMIANVVNKRANVLTCVSKDMVLQYQDIFKLSRHVCVYNIVDSAASRDRMHRAINHRWFIDKTQPVLIAAGQLEPWKGFDVLIKAVSILRHNRAVRLLILGDGSQKGDLQDLIDLYGLNDCIELLGFVDNPYKYFAQSDVFVLSSFVEGLPNVLVEAMMCGCTPVSTNCPTGPSEVIQDNKYGFLVPVNDPQALADAIRLALENPIARTLLEEAVVPFSEDAVIKRHFELLGLD